MKNILSEIYLLWIILIINCGNTSSPLIIETDRYKIEFLSLEADEYKKRKYPGIGASSFENKSDKVEFFIFFNERDNCFSSINKYDALLGFQLNENENNSVLAFNLNYTIEPNNYTSEFVKIYPRTSIKDSAVYRMEYWYTICSEQSRMFILFKYEFKEFNLLQMINNLDKYRDINVTIK